MLVFKICLCVLKVLRQPSSINTTLLQLGMDLRLDKIICLKINLKDGMCNKVVDRLYLDLIARINQDHPIIFPRNSSNRDCIGQGSPYTSIPPG